MEPDLTPKQVAELLGVSVSTLWRWERTKTGFPRGRRYSAQCVRWTPQQIRDFQASIDA